MWEISLVQQIISIEYSALLGFCLSIFYDTLKAVRKTFNSSKLFIFFQDIFFWIVSFAFTFLLLMARTNGELRGFIVISIFVGFIIYRITVSRYILKFFIFILTKIAKLSEWISRKNDTFSLWLLKNYKIPLNFIKKISKKVKLKQKNS